MSNDSRIISKILSGRSDANIRYNDVKSLLLNLGFQMRMKGSHHIFRKEGIDELINLQMDGNKAKPYQIKQIRAVLLDYNLTEEENG